MTLRNDICLYLFIPFETGFSLKKMLRRFINSRKALALEKFLNVAMIRKSNEMYGIFHMTLMTSVA